MDINYKSKYLKYKNKYLDLKGGANCPRLGFNQHLGECWNDGLSTLLLYTDTLSELIQFIFESELYQQKNGDTITLRIIPEWLAYLNDYYNNKELLPPNIEEQNFKQFIDYGSKYISMLFNRYHNDKKPVTKDKISTYSSTYGPVASKSDMLDYKLSFANHSEAFNSGSIRRAGTIRTSRPRADSTPISLACVRNIYEITNLNAINPKLFKEKSHGGNLVHELIIIDIINYFINGYIIKKKPDILTQKYSPLNPTKNYYINYEIFNLKKNYDMMMLKHYMTEIRTIYNGAIIICENESSGHVQSFITCNKINYFYDDNGTTVNNMEPLKYFDWKSYLIDKFSLAIRNNSNNIDLSDIYTNRILPKYIRGDTTSISRPYLGEIRMRVKTIIFCYINPSITIQNTFDDKHMRQNTLYTEYQYMNYNNQNMVTNFTRYFNLNISTIIDNMDFFEEMIKYIVLYENEDIFNIIKKFSYSSDKVITPINLKKIYEIIFRGNIQIIINKLLTYIKNKYSVNKIIQKDTEFNNYFKKTFENINILSANTDIYKNIDKIPIINSILTQMIKYITSLMIYLYLPKDIHIILEEIREPISLDLLNRISQRLLL
jgi:hypothetical protein